MHEEQTLGDLWEGKRERGRSGRGGGEAEIRSEVGMGDDWSDWSQGSSFLLHHSFISPSSVSYLQEI